MQWKGARMPGAARGPRTLSPNWGHAALADRFETGDRRGYDSAIALVVAAGLALRLFHYLSDPSVWHDEAALMMSVLRTPWSGLLGPLPWNEAAPPLFLAMEKGIVGQFGESTFAFRLLPLMASGAALALFAWTCRRILTSSAAVLATTLVAFSDRMLWHSCEAKPYAVDVLVSTLALAAISTVKPERVFRLLLLLFVCVPVAIWLSFPACFVVAGSLLALATTVWQARSVRVGSAYVACGVSASVALVALAQGPIRAQRNGAMESCWTMYFPDWSAPATVPWWMARSTVEVVDYCLRPVGGLLIVAAAIGVRSLAKRGNGKIVLAALVPLALNLAASLCYAYPYGGARIVAFALPAVALFTAEGLAAIGSSLAAWKPRLAWSPAAATVAIFVASAIAGVFHPWLRANVKDAIELVLRDSLPHDAIATNAWEPYYYLRNDNRFVGPIEPATRGDGRIWLVFVCKGDKERHAAVAESVPDGWSLEFEQDFARTTVARLGKLESTPKNASAPDQGRGRR